MNLLHNKNWSAPLIFTSGGGNLKQERIWNLLSPHWYSHIAMIWLFIAWFCMLLHLQGINFKLLFSFEGVILEILIKYKLILNWTILHSLCNYKATSISWWSLSDWWIPWTRPKQKYNLCQKECSGKVMRLNETSWFGSNINSRSGTCRTSGLQNFSSTWSTMSVSQYETKFANSL